MSESVWISVAYVGLGAFWVSFLWVCTDLKAKLPRAIQVGSLSMFWVAAASLIGDVSNLLSFLFLLTISLLVSASVVGNVSEIWRLASRRKKKGKWEARVELVSDVLFGLTGIVVFTLGLVFVIAAVSSFTHSWAVPICLIGMGFLGGGGWLFMDVRLLRFGRSK